MQASVCLGAILIPEYLDFHSVFAARKNWQILTGKSEESFSLLVINLLTFLVAVW